MNEKDRFEVMALIERRSIPEPNTGCWLWDARVDRDGYGMTKWHGIIRRAHRLSYQAFYNNDPGPLSVMHACDIACCVNPAHLAAGTTGENLRASAAKGRMGRGRKTWSMARGAHTIQAKIIVAGQPVTADSLRKVVGYDPARGEFRWLAREDDIGWTRKNAGKVAGAISQHGKKEKPVYYRRIRVFGRDHYAHRLAWLYVTGEWPDKNEVDHRDGNTLNNRFDNLRRATHAQNGHNTGLRRNNTSGVKGVTWDSARGRWQASITMNSKMVHLGRFDVFEDAVAARRAAETEYHGDFAHRGVT